MRKFTLLIALMIAASVCLQSYGFTDSTFGGYFGSPISNIDLSYLTPRQAYESSCVKFKYFIRYIQFNTGDLDLSGPVITSLRLFIDSVKALNGTPIIIVNPVDSANSTLSQISNGSFDQLMENFAFMLAQFNTEIIISFGPEMNGPWCAWGQQAVAYQHAFAEAAMVLRANRPNIKLAWVPNWAKGYPWNSSGLKLSGAYSDYYPGDNYVDYVGLNIYFKDWEEGDTVPAWFWQTSLDYLDFYNTYTIKYPMLITETAGVDFSKKSTGNTRVPLTDAEQKIFKTEYLQAIKIIIEQHPRLAAVCFFDVVKKEDAKDSSHDWGNLEIDFRQPFDVLCYLLPVDETRPVIKIEPLAGPNPCGDYLQLKNLPDDVRQIQLVDLFGQVVWRSSTVEPVCSINLAVLPVGVYACRVITPAATSVIMIVHN